MNARMRRIDLFCKLMGPLTISLVAMASTEIAIYTTLGMNVASVLVEYIFIEQVRMGPASFRTVARAAKALRSRFIGEYKDCSD